MTLNVCGVVRPIIVVIAMVAMLSIVAPGFFASIWPYLAAAAVLAVPALAWQLWNTRYSPGCSGRMKYQDPGSTSDISPK